MLKKQSLNDDLDEKVKILQPKAKKIKNESAEFGDDTSIKPIKLKKHFDDEIPSIPVKIIKKSESKSAQKTKFYQNLNNDNKIEENFIFTGGENDLLIVHEKMVKMLSQHYTQKVRYAQQLKDEFYAEHDNEKWTRHMQDEYNRIMKNYIKIYFNIDLGRYLYMTEMVIEIYQKIISKCVQVSFMPTKKSREELQELELMKTLRNIFFSAVGEFATVTSANKMIKLTHCSECNHKLNYDNGDDTIICCNKNCGTVYTSIVDNLYFKDTERVNVSSRYRYSEATYFRECCAQWQGKQNKKIPSKIYDGIYELMNIYGITPDTLTKELTLRFIKKIDSNFKEDLELIYSKIAGTSRPDISHLENKLTEMFLEFKSVYSMTNNSERDNFPNGYYLLFQFLRIIKYTCTADDFFGLKSSDRLREHDEILSRACEKLGGEWKNNFMPIV